MENLRNYDNFLSGLNFAKIKSDKNTTLFLEGMMTEKEWKEYCNDSLNESWWDDMKNWFSEKIISKLKSIYEAVMNGVAGAYLKIKAIIDTIVNGISGFKQKHPILFKVIVTFIVAALVIIFFIITSNSAKAGEPAKNSTMMWEYANGIINNYSNDPSSTVDKNLLMHAQAYCMDMKDGILGNEGIDWAKEKLPEIEKIVNIATKNFDTLSQEAMKGDKNAGSFIIKMCEQGKEFISFIHEHIGGRERIALGK